MMQRGVLGVVVAAISLAATSRGVSAQSVQPCPNPANCAEVSLVPAAITQMPNGIVEVGITFRQAPSDDQAGGPDEIAALVLSLGIIKDGATSAPLLLADCTLDADGLPAAVKPDAAIANFRVVVENASCANGRTHCLCPDAGSGIPPDPFINLVVFGPNPLPTPGPNPVDIPTLPTGHLVTIDLKATSGVLGQVRLHAYNQVAEPQRPQLTAFLSVGDKLAVDQTCVPIAGEAPCSGPQATSQVVVNDATVTLSAGCVGDCDNSGDVAINELITMVNIALGSGSLSQCPSGDADGSNDITIDEILKAVNNALNMCPQ